MPCEPSTAFGRAALALVCGGIAASLFVSTSDARRLFVPREHKSVQRAIDAASPGDTIWVAAGSYREALTLRKKLVLFGDGGPDSTFLDGGDSARVVHVEGVQGGAIIGFGIRGGKAVAGGGIYCLHDTTFSIESCTFTRNWESAVAAWDSRGIRIADCNFVENSGSAVRWDHTTGYISGCSFLRNTGEAGGALSLYRSVFLNPMRRCSFEENRAESSVGGAVYADSSQATISYCSFLRNSSAVAGGAVAAMNHTYLALSRCQLTENSAAQAGGAHADASQLMVGFCILARNRATAGGAAISALGRFDANVNPVYLNNTFYKNTTEGTGATIFAVRSSPEIRKNIFVVEGAQQLAVAGVESSPRYECNLIHDPAGGAIGSLPSSDTFVGDPLFCDPEKGNFDLGGLSPALRAPCGPIGARRQGCSSFQVQPSR